MNTHVRVRVGENSFNNSTALENCADLLNEMKWIEYIFI